MMRALIFASFFVATFAFQSLIHNSIFKDNQKYEVPQIETTEDPIEPLLKIRQESEAQIEKAEKINKGFDKMLEIVDIMGHLDSFVSEKTKSMLKKLASLADDENETPVRVQS